MSCVVAAGILGLIPVAPIHAQGRRSETKIEYPYPELAMLENFVGPWRSNESHFNSDGECVATAEGTETVIWSLDNRVLKRSYLRRSESADYRAIGMLTWNTVEKKYDGAWFDNVSTTGPNTVKGSWSEADQTFEFIIEALAPDGSKTRYKVIERFVDEKNRVATTYLLKGDEAIKRLEVQYTRAQACPSTPRMIGKYDR